MHNLNVKKVISVYVTREKTVNSLRTFKFWRGDKNKCDVDRAGPGSHHITDGDFEKRKSEKICSLIKALSHD